MRRAWQPAPGCLPGESYMEGSLVGYSLQGRRELDTTEQLTDTHEEEDTQTHSDGNDAKTMHPPAGNTSTRLKLGWGEPSERARPCPCPDFRLPASRPTRRCLSVALSHQRAEFHHDSPRKLSLHEGMTQAAGGWPPIHRFRQS